MSVMRLMNKGGALKFVKAQMTETKKTIENSSHRLRIEIPLLFISVVIKDS